MPNDLVTIDLNVTLQDAYDNGTGTIAGSVLKDVVISGTNTDLVLAGGTNLSIRGSAPACNLEAIGNLASINFKDTTGIPPGYVPPTKASIFINKAFQRLDIVNAFDGPSSIVLMPNAGNIRFNSVGLGIRTTNPQQPLHVVGNGMFEGSVFATNFVVASGGCFGILNVGGQPVASKAYVDAAIAALRDELGLP